MKYTVKKVSDIHFPNRNVTYQFPPRESLVSDISAGDGNVANLFYGVTVKKIPPDRGTNSIKYPYGVAKTFINMNKTG